MTTLNFALSSGIARTLSPGDEILITQLDHESNRGPWLRFHGDEIVVREVALTGTGELDRDDLAAKIAPRTRVVALGAASNALGTVNDIALARRLTREVGALLVIDAVHYAPHFPIDVASMDPDFLLCSGYKFYGPHVGVLYSKPGALDKLPTDRLRVQDPTAPYRIETGTLNHPAIDGVRAAIQYIASWGSGNTLRERIVDAMNAISMHEHGLAKTYAQEVARIPGVQVHGPDFTSRQRAPTVSITLATHTSDEAAAALAAQSICVWSGHFYAARAVEVLGLEQRGLLRTGISMYTGAADIDRLIGAIRRLS